MTIRGLVFGALLLTVAACASTTPTAPQKIDNTYKIDGFSWQSGATVYVLLKTFNAGGKVGVCGAWSARGGAAVVSHLHQEVLAAGSVTLDGRTLVQSLLFMQEHGPNGELKGKTSNCVVSTLDWQPKHASMRPDAVFPRMRFTL